MGEAFLMNHGGATMLRAELLWENAGPSNAFEAQTVELDLSIYDVIRIEFFAINTAHRINTVELRNIIDQSIDLLWYSTYNGKYYSRLATIRNNGIEFGNGIQSSNTAVTTHCIPFRIYGVVWSDMRDE